MNKNYTLSELISWTLSSDNKCYEKELSTRDMSVREVQKLSPHRIRHRFVIPNGISAREILKDNMCQSNALLNKLRSKGNVKRL